MHDSKSNYEGLFAWKPDKVEHGIWEKKEIHEKPFSPNIEVTKDWYGTHHAALYSAAPNLLVKVAGATYRAPAIAEILDLPDRV